MHLNGESSFILSITNVIIISWKCMFAIVVAKTKFLIYTVGTFFLFVVGYQKWDIASSFWNRVTESLCGITKTGTPYMERMRPRLTFSVTRTRCAIGFIFIVDCQKKKEARQRLEMNVHHRFSWRKPNRLQCKFFFSMEKLTSETV